MRWKPMKIDFPSETRDCWGTLPRSLSPWQLIKAQQGTNESEGRWTHPCEKEKKKRDTHVGRGAAPVVLRAIFLMSYFFFFFSISRHKGSLTDACTSSILLKLQKVTCNFKQKFLITRSHTERSAGLQDTHRSARHTPGFLWMLIIPAPP